MFLFCDGTGVLEGRINLTSGKMPAFAEGINFEEKYGEYFFVVFKPKFSDNEKKFYIQMIKQVDNYNMVTKHFSDVILSSLIRKRNMWSSILACHFIISICLTRPATSLALCIVIPMNYHLNEPLVNISTQKPKAVLLLFIRNRNGRKNWRPPPSSKWTTVCIYLKFSVAKTLFVLRIKIRKEPKLSINDLQGVKWHLIKIERNMRRWTLTKS